MQGSDAYSSVSLAPTMGPWTAGIWLYAALLSSPCPQGSLRPTWTAGLTGLIFLRLVHGFWPTTLPSFSRSAPSPSRFYSSPSPPLQKTCGHIASLPGSARACSCAPCTSSALDSSAGFAPVDIFPPQETEGRIRGYAQRCLTLEGEDAGSCGDLSRDVKDSELFCGFMPPKNKQSFSQGGKRYMLCLEHKQSTL